ncbi:D-alanyl-D-alanine carboxypeptidase family protein [uncultured Eubacterium sp.]|uniref:D-alanyl-D-alanine carboxypeptidase family protein n=1 Tax=uncultured Eubacterium sp. TaxID=165185 RepID=UPI002803EFC9|nr:D-alanyl-D-alanine carboxypeptidase family protein [uncultured Eubacterium sp.]
MKKILAILLCIVVMLQLPVTAFANDDKKKDDKINAKSVCLMALDTGEVLYAENEYEELSPASVTKIMSLLLVLEALDSGKIKLTDKVTASKEAVAMGGSQIWLEVGEVMTVEELLKAVIIASANDACTALGEYVAGSDVAFVKMMNDKAKSLGLKHTNFENCTGLDDTVKAHYSCAFDLAVISCEVMKHPLITKYSTIWLDNLRGGKTELNNTNKLVKSYTGITGLKTGTTSNAGFCVSATASRDGLNIVAVVLGSDTSEHRFDTASYLLDTGFANYSCININVDKKKIKPVKVKNGKEKEVTPVYDRNIKLIIPKGSDNLTYKYKIKKEVKAPIKKGDKLGKIEVISNDKKIKSIPLYSDKVVEMVDFNYIFLKIFKHI